MKENLIFSKYNLCGARGGGVFGGSYQLKIKFS
jgi:hypothetical protein